MVFEGMVPVFTQSPPIMERASTTATRFFILEAATAARWPEGPEPMTVRSYLTALMRLSPMLSGFPDRPNPSNQVQENDVNLVSAKPDYRCAIGLRSEEASPLYTCLAPANIPD